MKLLVGLGNPGEEYQRTRHNVGWRLAEAFADRHRIALDQKKWNARYGVGEVEGERVGIVLPHTYMNLAGEAAGPAMRFFKVALADVVALHDELDLPFGRLMLKLGGSSGGHNGLKSLTRHLGGPDYLRLRLGIGRPPPQWDAADYVLARFSGAEERELQELVVRGVETLDLVLERGAAAAMNVVNRRDAGLREGS